MLTGDWQLWCDWCAATGRQVTPTSVEVLAEFCAQVVAGRQVQRRRIRAVVEGCEDAGWPVDLPPTDRAAHWAAVQPLLAHIPRWGWPGGLNRRRDAFVVALHGHGFTRTDIRMLTPASVRLAAGLMEVDGVVLGRDLDRRLCGACAASDWLEVLAMVALGGRGEAQAFLVGSPEAGHSCTKPVGGRWRSAAQLVPAVDRHGWVDDTRPVSARTITEAVRSAAGWPVQPEIVDAGAPREPYVTPRRVRHDEAMDGLLDEMDDRIDAITARVDEILRQVTGPARKSVGQ